MTVWVYGDHINTDVLFPGRYTYTCSTPEDILPHLLEDLDPAFAKNAQAGDIILAGENFGCGSSREQPAVGLKALGITIIAKSFSRIFYRAAVNQGLIAIECPAAVQACHPGVSVKVDLSAAMIYIGEESFSFPPLPGEILEIHRAGGLLPYVRQVLQKERT